MKSKLIKALTVGAFIVSADTTAHAQQSSPLERAELTNRWMCRPIDQ